MIQGLAGALRAALPLVLETARRNERMGLREEAAAARDLHRRGLDALRGVGGVAAPRVEFED